MKATTQGSGILRRDIGRYALALLVLAACRRPLECTDTSGLSPGDLEIRERTLGYVDRSPNPARTCSKCQQFRPRAENECGRCAVVRGPVSPQGACSKWAAKPA